MKESANNLSDLVIFPLSNGVTLNHAYFVFA